MTEIIERDETEYLVVGETPDTPEKLEPGDRLVLDGLTVQADGQGYKVLADSPRFVGVTEEEADTVEALVERCSEPPEGKVRSLWNSIKGKLMDKKVDKALGEGRGAGGPRQSMGGIDTCACPECGHEEEHERNVPCAETKCPECGEPMQGKPEEARQKALGDWADELGGEAYKALLGHAAETERLSEDEMALLAPEELEDLVGGWLATAEGQKVGRRLRQKWVDDLTTWWKDVQDKVADFNDKLGRFFTWAKYEDEQETMPGDWASLVGSTKSGFKSFKGKDDKWRWIAWAASAFEDREQEYFKTKALERYVAEAYKKGDHGKLWFYHLPFAMGDADFTALPGESRILLKMGTWADDPFAQKAAAYFSRDDGDWGASVGYKYKAEDREDKMYDWLWVFETSPVPADKAAFPFSRFDSFGGKRMDVTDDQKAKLQEVFGEGWNEVLSRVESASKRLEEMGLAYKALQSDNDLMSVLGELLADEAIAEKAKANPVQMLKLALGKVKDEAAKGLIQKVIDALEKGDYAYPKPESKAEEKEEEYGKPKEKKKAKGEKEPKEKKEDEEDEEEEEPKEKGKKEADLPVQIEIEGLSELVEAVKTLKTQVEQQAGEIIGLKAMLEADDEERAGRKLKKAPAVVAYKASVAGLLDDDEEKDQEAAKMKADHPLAVMAAGTPLGPRGG